MLSTVVFNDHRGRGGWQPGTYNNYGKCELCTIPTYVQAATLQNDKEYVAAGR